jgi:hypothetical protein
LARSRSWRERNSLDFPSLGLDLTGWHAREAERIGQLADNVPARAPCQPNRFEPAVVPHPAHSAQIVSGDPGDAAKKAMAKAAGNALDKENWKQMIG